MLHSRPICAVQNAGALAQLSARAAEVR